MLSLIVSPRALFYWEIRLLFFTLPFAVISVVFFRQHPLIWGIYTLTWMLTFLFFAVFYYPLKFKRLRLSCDHNLLIVKSGVIYTRLRYAPLHSIQYVEMITFPLQGTMGMCSMVIRCAGYYIWLSSFDQKEAFRLKDLLSPQSKTMLKNETEA